MNHNGQGFIKVHGHGAVYIVAFIVQLSVAFHCDFVIPTCLHTPYLPLMYSVA